MFEVNNISEHSNKDNMLELSLLNGSSYARLDLLSGASLQELVLNEKKIIKSLHPVSYSDSYASAILFPFVNRIKDGKYSYNGKMYQLAINHEIENNAIHGLVYNKHFKVVYQEESEDKIKVVLEFNETNPPNGFPFCYTIQLTYILTLDSFTLDVKIKNTDSKTFPFSLGWHPYFYTSNLEKSVLYMDVLEKINADKRNIPIKSNPVQFPNPFKIEDSKFDDCFLLKKNEVCLKTPEYKIELHTTSDNKYLQLYTPENRHFLAIEPQTSPANSFNNTMGLKELQPNETFASSWNINLIENNNTN